MYVCMYVHVRVRVCALKIFEEKKHVVSTASAVCGARGRARRRRQHVAAQAASLALSLSLRRHNLRVLGIFQDVM